jgi:hypothetical protein
MKIFLFFNLNYNKIKKSKLKAEQQFKPFLFRLILCLRFFLPDASHYLSLCLFLLLKGTSLNKKKENSNNNNNDLDLIGVLSFSFLFFSMFSCVRFPS